MGLWNAIRTAEQGMSVHRYRSEIAAENLNNVHTPDYEFKTVHLRAGVPTPFESTGSAGSADASSGAVAVSGISTERVGTGHRQFAFLATQQMLQAKSAFDLNVRATALLKSMALASLEIGRGG